METIVSVVMSILLGMIPEVLFFTLFLVYTKNIKEKRLKLFLLIMISYILCITLVEHKALYYIIFMVLIYLSLKLLYKERTQIIDIFIINISFIYVGFISAICYAFVNNNFINYYIMLIFNRALLFIPFILKNKMYLFYKEYCKLWNRNDKIKRPIKSITLRNISLIALNIFIFVCDVVCLYILNLK